jgi:protocatechuate 3,4-dioxygenase beta subunit
VQGPNIAKGVALVAIVAAGLAIAWFAWGLQRQALLPAEIASPPVAHEPPAAPVAAPAAPIPAEPVRSAVAASAADGLTVRGRCVDASSGAPLAGCVVKPNGRRLSEEEAKQYEQEHGKPYDPKEKVEWTDPATQTTSASGEFSFTVVLTDAFAIDRLTIKTDERLPAFVQWQAQRRGVVDLGDLPLDVGCRVRGVVVDAQGNAQSGLRIEVERSAGSAVPAPSSLVQSRPAMTTRQTLADGSFELRAPPGTWVPKVGMRRVLAPETFAVAPLQREGSLRITVEPLQDAVIITGIVVDEAGTPVAGAEIDTRGSRGESGPDGSFRLEAPRERVQKYAELRVTGAGFDYYKTDLPWGTTDARLVLHRQVGLRIQVVAADTGAPIERYGVRCGPAPEEAGPRSGGDFALRLDGTHQDGIAEIPGIGRGRSTLLVQSDGGTHDHSQPTEIDERSLGPEPLRIALAPMTTCTVRVQTRDGVPVTGTKIEVLRPWTDVPIDLETFAWDPAGRSHTSQRNRAIKVSDGTTDETGAARLRGPIGVALALRALGPGHVPCVESAQFAAGSGITLVVSAGATLFGKIGPEGITAKLTSGSSVPGLVLSRREGVPKSFPTEMLKSFPLEPDGTFRWSGIPPGTWSVYVRFTRAAGAMGLWTVAGELVGTVELREGETRELRADLALGFPGKIVGRVQIDGAPASGARGQLVGKELGARGAAQQLVSGAFTIDDSGSFTAEVTPGEYRLKLSFQRAGRWVYMTAPETVVVVADRTVEQTFAVVTTSLRIRLLGAEGTPVEGVVVYAAGGGGDARQMPDWTDESVPTDAQGWTTFAAVPPGQIRMSVVRADLAKPSAMQEFLRENINDPNVLARTHIAIGPVTTRLGEVAEFEITLPAEAGY